MREHKTHCTIHVVDDEDSVRDILLRILHTYGFQVQTFDSAESYLESMQYENFDIPGILLSDIDMPGMNGFQLLREVQQRHPAVCCMLMSGDPDQCTEESLKQYALAGRVRHVFAKPFRAMDLKSILDEVTGN